VMNEVACAAGMGKQVHTKLFLEDREGRDCVGDSLGIVRKVQVGPLNSSIPWPSTPPGLAQV
jgi:hypothetical protein